MRRRLLLACISVTALAVLLLAIPLAVVVQRRQVDQDRRELTSTAARAADRVTVSDTSGLEVTVPPGAADQTVAVYHLDGSRAAGQGPLQLEPTARAAFRDLVVDTTSGGERVVVVPIIDEHVVVGAVRAAEPLSIGRNRVRQEWAALALGSIVVLSVASGVALWVARRLTRPLEQLRMDAVRIGDGDFTVMPLHTGVAEVDQVGSALASTAEHLGQLLTREQAFSADASHQLRTPLTGLRLSLENELAHPRPDGKLALHEALADVERLETTITGLLELARESSRAQRQPFDVDALLTETTARWRHTLAADHRTLRYDSDAIPPALASRVAVEHVLDVLLDNARRHGAGDVTVTAQAHRQIILIRVSDEGMGVEDPSSTFQRRSPGAAGTGIGLALARRLAEAEGGQLRLAHAGEHPEFELSLPVSIPPAS